MFIIDQSVNHNVIFAVSPTVPFPNGTARTPITTEPMNSPPNDTQVTKMLFLVVILFGICWFPFQVFNFLSSLEQPLRWTDLPDFERKSYFVSPNKPRWADLPACKRNKYGKDILFRPIKLFISGVPTPNKRFMVRLKIWLPSGGTGGSQS